ncbi:uncharacterized protein LOC122301750 [Carya illinoinensis]|uniref:uncharacterized protein LOC122301750 n=1 Tax=Carya illinoinensis TaxID=32201 RepID=UPI001C71AAB1|nr:uncharacterized protein LOC122301750 [Carya illinoinensis]
MIYVNKWSNLKKLNKKLYNKFIAVENEMNNLSEALNISDVEVSSEECLPSARVHFGKQAGSVFNDPIKTKVWQKCWRIRVPNAVKSFLWRAANESLPTKLNLYKRKVVESPLCPIYLLHPEFVAHANWSCKAAQDVWTLSLRRIQKTRVDNGSFREILKDIMANLTDEEIFEMAFTTKQIWNQRTTWVFENIFGPPYAAVDKSNSKVSTCVVIKDSAGCIIATLCSPKSVCSNPLLGEAAAALRALTFCAELGVKQIILEVDSFTVVNSIKRKEEN